MIKGIFGSSNTESKNIIIELEKLREENRRKDLMIMNLRDAFNQKTGEVFRLKKIINTFLDHLSCDNPDIIKIRNEILQKLGISLENGHYNTKREASVDSIQNGDKMNKLKMKHIEMIRPFELSSKIDLEKLMRNSDNSLSCGDRKKNIRRSKSPNEDISSQNLFSRKYIMPSNQLIEKVNQLYTEIKENSGTTTKSIEQFINQESEYSPQSIYEHIDKDMKILLENKYFKKKYSDEQKVSVLQSTLQNLIFHLIYEKIFLINEEDIKARDDQLKEKFYILQPLITFEVLEIPKSLRISSLYTMCQNNIQKINEYKTPMSKLDLFSNCANNLINIYYQYEKRIPSQDDLFPLFIYVILNANPDYLQSNIDFMQKYLKFDLMTGEYGFLVTSINAVALFLDSLDGHSLMEGKLLIRASSRGEY